MEIMKRPHSRTVIKEELDCDSDSHSSPNKSLRNDDLLKCELCSTVCSSVSQLQSHTLSEHAPDIKNNFSSPPPNLNSQRVACQQCEDTFDNFAQFAAHMKSHIGSVTSQIYFCPICPVGTSFRDKKSHLEHLTNQHLQVQVNQYACNECDTVFRSFQSWSVHFSEAHRKFTCASCGFVADSEKAFKDHSKAHYRQVVMHGCAVCTSTYSSYQSLLTHVQLTHDQDTSYSSSSFSTPTVDSSKPTTKPRLFQCSVCDEKVFGEDGLDEHRLKQHCKIRYSDKCADCQEHLTSEATFVEHCLRHAEDHNHHCPVCRQSLRSDAQIHAHCAYHMNPPEQKVSEDSISSASSSPTNSTFSFVCPICGEKLDDGFALIEHSKHHL
ncbi:hypothetical protein CAEBREN_07083 [Caenorhabditis brenneri]|uniref:C2H2-type domain-containing protein n=1 Tax=Caenorhabditis brenneri TaxID=135651 RepID=G0MYY7_CAEBE|nr:hypothetical protein CAEBREN_07083 [Caenorhabditis brenneri]